jgi:fatty acid desaturase
MSTFTMVHHTAPHIPFKNAKDWNSAAAQLGGTVHCDYPKWYVTCNLAYARSPCFPLYA